MVYRVAAGRAHILRRSAAVIVVVAAVSGCSSGAMRFTDGVPTASTQAQPIEQTTAQAYPGGSALAPTNVDTTYTGSVNRGAVQTVTAGAQRFWQRAFRAPIPKTEVGATSTALVPQQTAAVQPYPDAAPAAQPFPQAQPYPNGPVVRGPAPDPVVTQSSLPPVQQAAVPEYVDTTSTGSIASAAPASAGQNMVSARAGDTVRKLADRYGIAPNRLAQANGLSADTVLSAGQQIVIPAFGGNAAPAAPVNTAAAPADSAKSGRVPVPTRKPSDNVAVLPQQTRTETARAPAANGKNNSAGSLYVVKSGDTLSAIARRHGTSAAAIRAANGMESGVIRVGQKLVVPGGGSASVAAAPAGVDPITTGGTKKPNLDPIVTGTAGGKAPVAGYTPPKKAEVALDDAVQQAAAAPDATGIGRMRWPVRGKVVSDFGDARGPKKNDGIDISVPEGTPVKAAENGVVIYAGDGLKDFGNTVLVRHENGLVTVYGHASEIKVARGETVRRGQEIARSGVSGNADTPKLHFEVRKDSAPVDPAGFLE
jgi:murein DD-endopeptidase MepM/ murein hydrolase activator NlpD